MKKIIASLVLVFSLTGVYISADGRAATRQQGVQEMGAYSGSLNSLVLQRYRRRRLRFRVRNNNWNRRRWNRGRTDNTWNRRRWNNRRGNDDWRGRGRGRRGRGRRGGGHGGDHD